MHAHVAHADLFHEHFLSGVKNGVLKSVNLPGGAKVPASLLDRIARKRLSDPDCAELLREMEIAGISTTVLLIADFGFGYDESELTLETIYEHYGQVLTAHPDKFIVFGGADPRRGRPGLELFEKGVEKLGFRGLKLYPPCGYELDDEGLFPYYELCDHYRIPVLAHTGPSLPTMRGDQTYPASIMNASRRFERVNFVLGHAAFQNPEANIRAASERDNVFLETSGFQRVMQDREQIARDLRTLFERIPERVVFGTDWPMFNISATQKDWVDYFQGFEGFPEEAWEGFFWRNAETALGDR